MIKVFQERNIDCQNIQFKYSDSSRSDNFSVHIVSNYYFDTWNTQCKFIKKVFSKELDQGVFDKDIYTEGGRAMRIIGSTKYVKNSFLTPIEIDQDRNDRNKKFIDDCNDRSKNFSDEYKNDIDSSDNHFILPDIEEEPDLLEHMVGYISDKCYRIHVDDKLLNKTVKNMDRKIAVIPGNSNQIESLGKLIIENIEAFKPWVDDYHQWFVLGVKMVVADIPYECFSVVSSQSSKFEEHKCQQKWENIVSSYADEPKDINQLIRFMKNIGINVQLGYSNDVSNEKLDFSVFMFDKEIMIDYKDEDNPKVKSEYTCYTIDTLK